MTLRSTLAMDGQEHGVHASPAAAFAPRPGQFRASPTLSRGLLTTAIAGGLVFLLGTMIDPTRTWGGYLMGFTFFVGLALAGPLFLSIHYLSRASWSKPLRRIPEAMTGALPAAFALGLVLIIGTHSLYEWSHSQGVAEDALLRHKAPYLNIIGFSVRLLIYFGAWIWIGNRVAARSTAVAEEGVRRRRDISISALFMAVLAVTFSLASIDWIQSLDPHWFSTMFALRTLSGVGNAGLAACVVTLLALRRAGPMRGVVTRDVMDDLGKILLALSLFWAYIWYCEYMIIWYSNVPEETLYYVLRKEGNWGTLMQLNLIVNFAIPFLLLMLRAWRRSGVVLMRIAVLILAGRVLDLYVMIAPPLQVGQGSGARFGLWEVGPIAGALALFGWILVRGLSRAPVVPEA